MVWRLHDSTITDAPLQSAWETARRAPQEDRARVLAALEMVDYVCIFDEETPAELIATVVPDVLVKGGDYRADQIVGRDTVRAAGGRVVVVEDPVTGTDVMAIRKRSLFSLGYDHRIVDGADAARFLARLKELMESFPEDA